MIKEVKIYIRVTVSSTSGVVKTGQIHAKKMNLDYSLTLYTKINSKWVKDLNIRAENIGSKPSDTSLSNIFMDVFSLSKGNKRKNKRDYIELKSFCAAKETINKTKRQPTKWEKILANDTFDKRPICKIYKEII